MSLSRFRTELTSLINSESRENGSNTPDWILANFLTDCLRLFDAAVNARERWHGREPQLISDPAPTITELEHILAEEDEPITINPDGLITRVAPAR